MAYNDKYGTRWGSQPTALEVEFQQIRRGPELLKQSGRSLFIHFRNAFSLLWPDDDHHRWSDLVLKSFCENDLSVFIGCSDSGKTWTMSKIILVDYWIFPEKTLWLVSTTEGRGSELRIWGCIKDLFNQARARGHLLPGHPVDYLKTITTEEIDAEGEKARSLRKGIIVVPCKTGGTVAGLAPYIGIKAPRLRHCGDEVQAMNDAFLNAYANWYGKEDFKGVMAGNFMATDDPLGIASEPVDGWDSFVDDGKTQLWRGKFYDAQVVALDGRDSPNFDPPYQPGKPPRFRYMIGEKKLNGVTATKGRESWEWYSQCVGKPIQGMDIWRVLNRPFCRNHHALDDVVWRDGSLTKIYGLDPAYGGGDRCVGRMIEFGSDMKGDILLKVGRPEEIKIAVSAATRIDPEDQIATYIKSRLEQLGIPAKNCFYDSFGRGTLGFSFSKLFGTDCPIPVDSSGDPSARPVRFDLFVEEKNGSKRLKRCDEHYKKFITELWFAVREAIDSEQVRELDQETMSEGCARKFDKKTDKIEIEPKSQMKERLNRSPDLFDCLAVCVEGARQRGFKIKSSGTSNAVKKGPDWLDKTVIEQKKMLKSRQLEMA